MLPQSVPANRDGLTRAFELEVGAGGPGKPLGRALPFDCAFHGPGGGLRTAAYCEVLAG